jgi:hypothetical protein
MNVILIVFVVLVVGSFLRVVEKPRVKSEKSKGHTGCIKVQNIKILSPSPARPLNWRERGRKRESFTEIRSFLERFSPHVEIQCIFYRALSLQKGENLSTSKFLSLSLSFSPPPAQFLSNWGVLLCWSKMEPLGDSERVQRRNVNNFL